MIDLYDIQAKIKSATDEAKVEYGADEVDVHSHGFTLRWENEAEPIENVHEMISEQEVVTEQYPDAEISARADHERYSVSAWYSDPEEDCTCGEDEACDICGGN